MKILIAEDDHTSRLLLREIMKPYGPCQVVVNGREAVEAVAQAHAENAPFTLICLDIMMPEMDGQQALQQIRELEEGKGIPPTEAAKVIMTTALNDVRSVSDSYYLLCDAYVSKPLDRKRLQHELAKLGLIKLQE
jgi:two-component system chemotaxis response regulator CheY